MSTNILLVEDDTDHADLIREAVEECAADCTLNRVSNGEEAMQYLRREAPFADASSVDLALVDINMPRMNGIEVTEQAKSDPSLRHIPLIILSTSDAARDKRRASEACANSYLVKPVLFDDLLSMVESTLNYWTKWHSPSAPN